MTWFLSFMDGCFLLYCWHDRHRRVGNFFILFFIFSVISFWLDLKLPLRKQMDKQTTTVWKFPSNVCWWSQCGISSNKYHFFLWHFFFLIIHLIGKRNKNSTIFVFCLFLFFFFPKRRELTSTKLMNPPVVSVCGHHQQIMFLYFFSLEYIFVILQFCFLFFSWLS